MTHDFRFTGTLEALDPDVYDIIQREDQRQDDTIILIASESESPPAIAEAMASSFAHVYAEGYPRESSRKLTEEQILKVDWEVARYRRLSDPRYYKGVEYADVIEALTRRRAAELFAANGVSADNLYVNVQPLSGGPANNAVYTALLQPGDTVMGLKLSDGGHLSHGAPVNRSGLVYNSVSYKVDPKLQAINYDAVEKLALKVKPKVIVAGYSAYPLLIDWQRFRDIADKVGAKLLADIAHISGLVASGAHPSPIGIADVVTTTTHKSLCGPRGAMIMTHHKELSRKIDKAVFPGEQGGPHLNTMVALAVALKLAGTEKFKQLQYQIVRNAGRLAEKLKEHGIGIAFGGSENHLLLIDCTSIRAEDGTKLSGDLAARILDTVGIVANRNNIPGDKSALKAFGVRIGLVWPTQRGFRDAEIDLLAEAIAVTLKGCTPFYYRGRRGKILRAKVDPAALKRAREIVGQLTGSADRSTNTHTTVEVSGSRTRAFLHHALASDVLDLADGEAQATHIFGHELDVDAVITRNGDRFLLQLDDAATAAQVRQWFADLSDGYVAWGDLHGKMPGAVVVKLLDGSPEPSNSPSNAAVCTTKPCYIGKTANAEPALPTFTWTPPSDPAMLRTNLYATHKALGAKLVPFGGYEMPVWYSSVSDEHAAVRNTAGLFDVSHMGVFDMRGENAEEFLQMVTANDVNKLRVGMSHYTYLFDTNGRVIDDLLIYRLAQDNFMLVVNASNNDEDWAWLNAVNEGKVCIDNDNPASRWAQPVAIRDLRDPQHGADCRVDLAIQGPQSRAILQALAANPAALTEGNLPWGGVTRGNFGGFDLIVSRTGYTGERVAYELFVHPDEAVAFWNALLEAGEAFGLKPCGLAARDSTRTEAGLPLHGHELAGPLAINPLEAGFGKFVKIYKPFFIGRSAYIKEYLQLNRAVVRFRMDEKAVRRPDLGDPIVDKRGKVIGTVTSCAIDSDGYLLGQALMPRDQRKRGTSLSIYQTGGGKRPLRVPAKIKTGARLPVPSSATVLSRFPAKK